MAIYPAINIGHDIALCPAMPLDNWYQLIDLVEIDVKNWFSWNNWNGWYQLIDLVEMGENNWFELKNWYQLIDLVEIGETNWFGS